MTENRDLFAAWLNSGGELEDDEPQAEKPVPAYPVLHDAGEIVDHRGVDPEWEKANKIADAFGWPFPR